MGIDNDTSSSSIRISWGSDSDIIDSYESPDAWCFGLAVTNDKYELIPLMGDNITVTSESYDCSF